MLGATEVPKEEQIRKVHRPPFSAREDLFLAVCNGCGDCVSACPNNLLRLVHNKAELDIEYMACDLCGKCAEACQTHALYPYFPADTGLRPQFWQRLYCSSRPDLRCLSRKVVLKRLFAPIYH